MRPHGAVSTCIRGRFAGYCSREARERRVIPGAAPAFLTAADPVQTRYEQARSLALGGARVAAPNWMHWLHARGSPVVLSVEAEDPAWTPRAERQDERLRRMLLAGAAENGQAVAAGAEALTTGKPSG